MDMDKSSLITMNDLAVLSWRFENTEMSVVGSYSKYGAETLQLLAMMIYESRHRHKSSKIQICNLNGTLLEDWSKGYKRTSTDILNEQLEKVLNKNNP